MLTDRQCRAAKARDKAYKMGDEKGLYLYVTPTGYKSWRLKYRFAGKEKRLTFGPYPEVKISEARELRDDARRAVRKGIDPSKTKKARASATAPATFEEVAKRWHEDRRPLWTKKHAANVWASLEKEVFPAIGKAPIGEVSPGDVRNLLLKVQERGAIEAAHHVRGRISAIFRMAIVLELAGSDPAAAMAAVLKPIKKGRMPAIEKLAPLRVMLADSESIPAHPATKLAARLLALTAARPGMIRYARRDEFEALETDEPLWRVPAVRMKQELALKEDGAMEFLLPLAPQAVEVVQTAMTLSAASSFLFPSTRFSLRPMSENALNVFYRRVPSARGKHVPHGWRSSFSTIMNERAALQDRPGDRAVIDLMLAHKPQGVEAIYNRAAYMPRRRVLAQEWADLLLEGFAPASALMEGPRH